ncbi:MAG: DUF2085 domain-containing protein [Oscillochloridaceae bacterium umkhey_bin13]
MQEPNPDEILAMARERMAEQREAQRATRQAGISANEQRWGLIFLAVLASLILSFVFWPGADLEQKLFVAVSGLVAQKHLVFMGERPLPLCARNLGLYSGFVLSLGLLGARGRGLAAALPARPLLITLLIGMGLMVFDGINSVLEDTGRAYLYMPRNDLRTLTGLLFAFGLTPIIILIFNRALRVQAQFERPVIGWPDYALLLGLGAIFLLLSQSGLALLFWPLALFGVIGIVSQLFMMYTMVAAVAMGYSRRVTSLAQLGRPACLGLLITVLFVGGLAWLRASS